MGFHGYGGSELDHSECILSPCSACRQKQLQQLQLPSVRSGNAYSQPASNLNASGSSANAIANENRESSEVNRASGADNVAHDTTGLSGSFRCLSILDEQQRHRALRYQILTGFHVPSTSEDPDIEDPALSHPVGGQNHNEDPRFQHYQNQSQNQQDHGHARLSEEQLALRDEMRRSGFRIPSVSEEPAPGHQDGSQNRPDSSSFQPQGQYQAGNSGPTASSGSLPPGSATRASPFFSPGGGFRGNDMWYPDASQREINYITAGIAPWADEHPTTHETLRRVLRNKTQSSYNRTHDTGGYGQRSSQSETASQGGPGRSEVPRDRLTQPDGSEMQVDDTYDWESADETRLPDSQQAERQNERRNERRG